MNLYKIFPCVPCTDCVEFYFYLEADSLLLKLITKFIFITKAYYKTYTHTYTKIYHDCCCAAVGHLSSNLLGKIRFEGRNWAVMSEFRNI